MIIKYTWPPSSFRRGDVHHYFNLDGITAFEIDESHPDETVIQINGEWTLVPLAVAKIVLDAWLKNKNEEIMEVQL